jgi:hypothetical protein
LRFVSHRTASTLLKYVYYKRQNAKFGIYINTTLEGKAAAKLKCKSCIVKEKYM